MDLTWVNDRIGWVFGAAPCQHLLCPEVASTADGGQSWHRLPTPPALIDNHNGGCARSPCVSHIRFVDLRLGYLYGPALLVTRDGGMTWQPDASPPVESLEVAGGNVYRLLGNQGGCAGPCDRTVQSTPVGSNSWRTLLNIPSSSYGDTRVDTAQVIPQGSRDVYVTMYGSPAAESGSQPAVLFRSTDAGGTWQHLSDPCGGSGTDVNDAMAFAAAAGGFVVALCVPRTGDKAGVGDFVVSSADAESSWGPARAVPGSFLGMIAAANSSRLAVASAPIVGAGPNTYDLLTSADGGAHWTHVVSDAEELSPKAPLAGYLAFENASQGWWVGYLQSIWTTQNGGVHWVRRNFP